MLPKFKMLCFCSDHGWPMKYEVENILETSGNFVAVVDSGTGIRVLHMLDRYK